MVLANVNAPTSSTKHTITSLTAGRVVFRISTEKEFCRAIFGCAVSWQAFGTEGLGAHRMGTQLPRWRCGVDGFGCSSTATPLVAPIKSEGGTKNWSEIYGSSQLANKNC